MNNATTSSSSCYFLPLLTPVVSVGVTFQELNVLNFCSFSRYKQVKWLVRTVTKLLISISPTSTTEHGWWHPKTCSLTSMNIYYGSRRYTTSRESVGKKKYRLAIYWMLSSQCHGNAKPTCKIGNWKNVCTMLRVYIFSRQTQVRGPRPQLPSPRSYCTGRIGSRERHLPLIVQLHGANHLLNNEF